MTYLRGRHTALPCACSSMLLRFVGWPMPAFHSAPFAAEGRWRPVDYKCDWFELTTEPQAVAAALAAARAPSAAGASASQAASAAAVGVKTEPGSVAEQGGAAAPSGTATGTANGTVNGTANGAPEELVLDSDSEEEDEMEELRKAAAAVRRASAGAIQALAGQVRGLKAAM